MNLLREAMYEAMDILNQALIADSEKLEIKTIEEKPKSKFFLNPYKKMKIIPAPVIVDEEV